MVHIIITVCAVIVGALTYIIPYQLLFIFQKPTKFLFNSKFFRTASLIPSVVSGLFSQHQFKEKEIRMIIVTLIHRHRHCPDDDKYAILPYFWVPEDTLDLRVSRDHVPYDVWERQGFLQTTEGNVVHYGYIEKFIERLGERFNIREIVFDSWGAVQMVQNLENM